MKKQAAVDEVVERRLERILGDVTPARRDVRRTQIVEAPRVYVGRNDDCALLPYRFAEPARDRAAASADL